jgi:hypothetical protein
MAALLHDIGKIGIPDSVLRKPGRLDNREWEIMKRHDEIGVTIVQEAFGSEHLSALIGAHHAWFAGNPSDPSLPCGEAIPLGARILAIAEAFDTMVSGSIYKSARSREQAFDELRACAGTQFDPQLVERFIAEVTARDMSDHRRQGTVSRELVVSLAGGAADLASVLEQQDTAAAASVAQRLQRTAQRHNAPELHQLAEQLEQVATDCRDLVQLAATAGELLDLCRRTQRDYLNARERQESLVSGELLQQSCASGDVAPAPLGVE